MHTRLGVNKRQMIDAKLAKIVWWTAVRKPSEKKAVLGYLHTRFSYYLREKKKFNQLASFTPPTNFAAVSSSLFRHLGVFNFEFRAPDPIREGGHCADRSLSNLILGMDGFWLEACQGQTSQWSIFGQRWRHIECFSTYSKFDLHPMFIVSNTLGLLVP